MPDRWTPVEAQRHTSGRAKRKRATRWSKPTVIEEIQEASNKRRGRFQRRKKSEAQASNANIAATRWSKPIVIEEIQEASNKRRGRFQRRKKSEAQASKANIAATRWSKPIAIEEIQEASNKRRGRFQRRKKKRSASEQREHRGNAMEQTHRDRRNTGSVE